MTVTSRPLALIVLVMFLGGITISSATGWWATESTKVPVTFLDGEFAEQADPVDIGG